MIKKNSNVVIRKMAATESSLVRTPADDAYIPGADNPNLSLPIDYEIEGDLLLDVVIGKAMVAFRRKRNGVEVPGIFESTPVVSIEHRENADVVRTANSVYEVIQLSPANESEVPV